MEKLVGTEVVREIQLRQEVAIQVGRSGGKCPARGPRRRCRRIGRREPHVGRDPAVAPAQRRKCFVPPFDAFDIECCIGRRSGRARVEDARAVRKVVADDEVVVTVSIEVRQRCGIRDTTAPVPPTISTGWIRLGAEGSVESQEGERSAAPEVHDEVTTPVLVQVPREAPHRSNRRGIQCGRYRRGDRKASNGRRLRPRRSSRDRGAGPQCRRHSAGRRRRDRQARRRRPPSTPTTEIRCSDG